jgi:sulfane dehydrogenase subunit SoxC
MNTRRRMLVGTSAVALGAMVAPRGRAADDPEANVPPNIPEWMKHEGLPLQGQSYTLPSKFEKHVTRKGRGDEAMPGSGSIQSPLQDLRGMITPSGLTFERSHAGVPEIDPTQHRLIVHGLVKRPLILTMDDIVRFPSVSRIHFLECSGNSSREWRKPFGKTAQITHGLISCCEWTGVLLSTVLQETGLLKGAS